MNCQLSFHWIDKLEDEFDKVVDVVLTVEQFVAEFAAVVLAVPALLDIVAADMVVVVVVHIDIELVAFVAAEFAVQIAV